eukprot:scaffold30108_cov31-Tisochrysis_lutea.AAC.6
MREVRDALTHALNVRGGHHFQSTGIILIHAVVGRMGIVRVSGRADCGTKFGDREDEVAKGGERFALIWDAHVQYLGRRIRRKAHITVQHLVGTCCDPVLAGEEEVGVSIFHTLRRFSPSVRARRRGPVAVFARADPRARIVNESHARRAVPTRALLKADRHGIEAAQSARGKRVV